jgi:hypothetical protein
MGYDVHIVRTPDWVDAEKNPITKSDVDALIDRDRELSWSTSDFVDMKDRQTGTLVRYFCIAWNGQPCFWWYRAEVRCKNPKEAQIAKMVTMAQALRAYVVGDDKERYELRRSLLGREKVVIIRP